MPAEKSSHPLFLRLSTSVLLLSILLTTLAVLWKQSSMETSLAQQARRALAIADLPVVSVSFSGRDGFVGGLLADKTAETQIIETVRQVEGVRSVHNQLLIHANAATKTSPADDPSGKQHPLEEVDLGAVKFAQSGATLTREARAQLDQFAALLRAKYPNATLEIAAHTDNRGSVLGQMASTQAQAESVLQYLVDQGVDINRLSARGYGASRPLTYSDDAANQARNRRIEITVRKE